MRIIMILVIIFCSMQVMDVHAWVSTCPHRSLMHQVRSLYALSTSMHRTPSNLAAGFGSSNESNKKEVKLKPKQQWDRYMNDLKKMNRVKVGVRIAGTEEWFEVGSIKSLDNMYTEYAAARQRALIADHARRLFPLQVSSKDKLEWGYNGDVGDSNNWLIVDKSIVEKGNLPEDLDKKIGFEGTPDPTTGYYCVYNEGRLVNMADVTADLKQASSKGKRS